jgi:hypothetical protein
LPGQRDLGSEQLVFDVAFGLDEQQSPIRTQAGCDIGQSAPRLRDLVQHVDEDRHFDTLG